jgi:tetratricopeptide (TPR) repeat protein
MGANRPIINVLFKCALVISVQMGMTDTAAIAQGPDYRALCAGGGGATVATVLEGCTKVIEAGPDGPELAAAYNNRAFAHRFSKDYDRAIQDYNDAIRLKPNWAVPYNNRGVTYRRKGEYDKAIKDYTHAIGLDGNYPAAYHNRAVAFLESGHSDIAIADFEKVLSFNSKNALALYGRGVAKMKAGDIAGGSADMAAAQRLNPNVRAEFEPGG